MATLLGWLRRDTLALAGPSYEDVLLCTLSSSLNSKPVNRCAHTASARCARTWPTIALLLLAFAKQLEEDLNALAADFHVPVAVVRAVFNVHALDLHETCRWAQEARLRQQLGGRFFALSQAVTELARSTVRARSVVENFNSRLRNYFFLRKTLGQDYLHLSRFFLNHRRFLRSEHPERVGTSPAELLTGASHAHWLDLLGFTAER